MAPERFRIRSGFAAIQAAPLALLTVTPAYCASATPAQIVDAVPLAIAVGALGFGLLAGYVVRRSRRDSDKRAETAYRQMADLRAELDLAASLLDGLDDVTMLWRDSGAEPRVYGRTDILLPGEPDPVRVADFRTWLTPTNGATLARLVNALRTEARAFETSLVTLDGRLLRLCGRILGDVAVVRIRPATVQPDAEPQPLPDGRRRADAESVELLFDLFTWPAWVRNSEGALTHANAAYWRLADRMGRNGQAGGVPEIFNPDETRAILDRLADARGALSVDLAVEGYEDADTLVFPVEGGTAGFMQPRAGRLARPGAMEREFGPGAAIIDAIATPIAIFDGDHRLAHFNTAYAEYWDFDADWLKSGPDESTILDRLRTRGLLPNEVDYRAWRSKHLQSYGLKASREESWYLPDGQVLSVVSVPAAGAGVIYIFENITERLQLASRYNALIEVQGETLGALSEGVAVFGTNGRLTLHNRRLSELWKLPLGELAKHPHIDRIAEACAAAMPDDGAAIWADLKENIIDLNPARTDRSGRVTRADGRVIDYAATRLPDGQTLMTFMDVTESINYQHVLKERNDALVTADRLKDAFVQNVSYELRSPLTNIIGFADLLASGTAGSLNEKQRTYTDYIRASSQTLGVLIDNILDLATADAGVAELRLQPQDVASLVERARAGLAGMLTAEGSGAAPNLTVDIEEDLPEFIADGTRIVQVLYNLLSNAVRFSAPGANVRLGVSHRAGRVVFAVEDEGVGISDEVKAALFQRFEGRSSEGRQRGAGLGLAIVKTFVSLHGGTVSLERREPKGTRVVVSIPANPAEAVSAAE